MSPFLIAAFASALFDLLKAADFGGDLIVAPLGPLGAFFALVRCCCNEACNLCVGGGNDDDDGGKRGAQIIEDDEDNEGGGAAAAAAAVAAAAVVVARCASAATRMARIAPSGVGGGFLAVAAVAAVAAAGEVAVATVGRSFCCVLFGRLGAEEMRGLAPLIA